jgi:hypothetical protein
MEVLALESLVRLERADLETLDQEDQVLQEILE